MGNKYKEKKAFKKIFFFLIDTNGTSTNYPSAEEK